MDDRRLVQREGLSLGYVVSYTALLALTGLVDQLVPASTASRWRRLGWLLLEIGLCSLVVRTQGSLIRPALIYLLPVGRAILVLGPRAGRLASLLVLTTFDEDELVFRSIDAGTSGYLLKDVGSDALADAVRAASRGEAPLQPSVARTILGRLRATPPGPATRCGPALAGAGLSEIAVRLALTEGTVKNYVSAILAKTGLHDRTQAALFAVRHNLTRDRSA